MVLGPWITSLVFWALKSLRSSFGPLNCFARVIFGSLNRQDEAHVQKNTNGGCSLYVCVPVQSCFEVAVSITWSICRGLTYSPLQIPLVMDTAASKQFCTGTYKLHPPLIVTFSKASLYLPSSLAGTLLTVAGLSRLREGELWSVEIGWNLVDCSRIA